MRTAGWSKLSPSDGNVVLESARLAPSVHNSRPWRVRQVMDGFELYGSPDWWLPGTDPDLRELRMSCGAALLNMRLSLAAIGFNPYVRLQPDPGRKWLLAVIRAGQRRELAPGERPLVEAIPKRRTSRAPFLPVQVPISARHALRRAAETEQTWLTSVEDPELRRRVRGLVQAAHQAQLKRPDFVAEWRRWTGLPDTVRPGSSLGEGVSVADLVDEWVLRDLPGGGNDQQLAEPAEEPMIAVLGSYHDRPVDALQSGQAMQRVLLTATALGLSASFVAQPVEEAEQRRELRRLLRGRIWPQMVLRIGYGQRVNGHRVSGQRVRVNGQPVNGRPVSGQPVSGQPVSGHSRRTPAPRQPID
jgi:nitroreductase